MLFTEHIHRIPINAIKHTDFGVDSILINVKNYTINGIILLHKFFLLKHSFLCHYRLLATAYMILNITLALNDFQCLFSFDKSVKKWLYQIKFCYHENFLTRDTGISDRLPDFCLIVIHIGSVNQPHATF